MIFARRPTQADHDALSARVTDLERRLKRVEDTMLTYLKDAEFPHVEREPYADHTRRGS